MRSMNEQLEAQRWLEKYINTPIKNFSREEASKNLARLGILDENGEIKSEWRDLIVKKD